MKHFFSTIVLLLATSAAFATNGTRMIGFDAASVGRGGTAIAVFDGPSLMMTNPAGIGFLQGRLINGDFSLMVPALKFSNGVNGETAGKTNYFPIAALGFSSHPDGSPFAWGAGVFTQGGMGADFTLNHQLFRDQSGAFIPQEYHSKLAVMQGGLSAAYLLTPELSIGASAHLVYSMLEFKIPYSLSPAIMAGPAMPGMTFGQMFAAPPAQGGFGYSEVTAYAQMNDLTGIGFSGKLGIAYKVNDRLSLGLAYTSPTALTYKNGKAAMDMTAQLNNAFGLAVQGYMAQHPGTTPGAAQAAVMAQFAGLGIDMSKGVAASYDLQTKLTLPQSIGAGASLKVTNSLLLALDVEWMNWSAAFDKMSLSLANGANPNVNKMLGNSGSFGLDFPMNWKDAVNVRLGAEFEVTTALTLRAGFAYGSDPVPDATVFPVFPAIVDSHLMAGASYQIAGPIGINLTYEMALNKKQTASNPSTLAKEYNSSISQLSENIFHLSFDWGLK